MNDDNNTQAQLPPSPDTSHDAWHHKAVIAVTASFYVLVLGTVLLTQNYQTYTSSAQEPENSGFIAPTSTPTPFPTTDPCITPKLTMIKLPPEPSLKLIRRPTPPPGTRVVTIVPSQAPMNPWPTVTPVSPTPIPSGPASTTPTPIPSLEVSKKPCP